MAEFETRYPGFHVMAAADAWDPHTREIVSRRLAPSDWQSLTLDETVLLHQICRTLLADGRDDVIDYVVHHIDQRLTAGVGEAQRRRGVPEEAVLIRSGIKALDDYCTLRYGALFAALDGPTRTAVLEALDDGSVGLTADGVAVPPKSFFEKLLSLAVSAYYSHPTVWSEIGYAGPAYPRGYVRSERGLTDPWEARRNDE